MSGLHYDSLEDMPDGLRKLVVAQTKAEGINTPPTVKNAQAALKEPKRKYHNKPTERILPNGECIKFRSKKEAAYYDGLCAQRAAGTVRKIRLEQEYLLKPAYTDGDTGERFRAITYNADFVFERLAEGEWKEIIVDTKGGNATKTAVYQLKRKLMAEKGFYIEEA